MKTILKFSSVAAGWLLASTVENWMRMPPARGRLTIDLLCAVIVVVSIIVVKIR